MAGYCPCHFSGCGMQCVVQQTCWENSISATLTDYEPDFVGACDDLEDWFDGVGEEDVTCGWVAKDADARCVTGGDHSRVYSGGRPGARNSAACPESCGGCDAPSTTTTTTTATSSPTQCSKNECATKACRKQCLDEQKYLTRAAEAKCEALACSKCENKECFKTCYEERATLTRAAEARCPS